MSAEEVSDNVSADILSVDEVTTAEQTPSDTSNANTSGAPVESTDSSEYIPTADLAVKVIPLYDFGNMNTWSILVYNYGPDTAENTLVALGCSDNLMYYDHFAYSGVFDPDTSVWAIGDLAEDEYTELLLAMYPIGPGHYYVEAVVVSDTYDPDLSDNYDIAYIGLEDNAPACETLPATGNPLVVALLALFVVGVGGLKRRL